MSFSSECLDLGFSGIPAPLPNCAALFRAFSVSDSKTTRLHDELQIASYGACVSTNVRDLKKDICAKEFQELQACMGKAARR